VCRAPQAAPELPYIKALPHMPALCRKIALSFLREVLRLAANPGWKFARLSLEESGFEPSVPPYERVGLSGRNANASQATRMVSNASAM
jgi:hypothetical protein